MWNPLSVLNSLPLGRMNDFLEKHVLLGGKKLTSVAGVSEKWREKVVSTSQKIASPLARISS